MIPWLLLLLTLVCAGITAKAFIWASSLKAAPFSIMAPMWKGQVEHLSLNEQNALKTKFASPFGAGKIAVLLLVFTAFFAALTVKAFLGVEG